MTEPRAPRTATPTDTERPNAAPPRPRLIEPGKRVIEGDLTQVLRRPWTRLVGLLVLVAAAGVDVATFYQVLVLVMNAPEPVVWGAVVGFTAVALALAHQAGLLARSTVSPRNPVGSKVGAWVCFGVWAALGFTAFVVRLVIEEAEASSGSTFIVDGQPLDLGAESQSASQWLSALLFLVLYVATGTVSSLAGYLQPSPAAGLWPRARRQRAQENQRYATAESARAFAEQLQKAIQAEREHSATAWAAVDQQSASSAERLKRETRLMIETARYPRQRRGWFTRDRTPPFPIYDDRPTVRGDRDA